MLTSRDALFNTNSIFLLGTRPEGALPVTRAPRSFPAIGTLEMSVRSFSPGRSFSKGTCYRISGLMPSGWLKWVDVRCLPPLIPPPGDADGDPLSHRRPTCCHRPGGLAGYSSSPRNCGVDADRNALVILAAVGVIMAIFRSQLHAGLAGSSPIPQAIQSWAENQGRRLRDSARRLPIESLLTFLTELHGYLFSAQLIG